MVIDLNYDPETNLIADADSYKLGHWLMLPDGTTATHAHMLSRGGRYGRTSQFGMRPITTRMARWAQLTTKERMLHVEECADFAPKHGLPFNYDGWKYIADDLGGRLPMRIRSVKDGASVPVRNVLTTVDSTDKRVPWVPGWFETQIMRAWYPTTVCTKSFYAVKVFWEFLKETSDDPLGEIDYKLHDFGARGVSCPQQAIYGGTPHLVNSKGTDTMSAAIYAKRVYGTKEPVAGYSIPALEHSSVIPHKDQETAFLRFIEKHPEHKLLSAISDTIDIYDCVENIWCGSMLDVVKASGKTIVIRPDSGKAPVIMPELLHIMDRKLGCTVNGKGYKVLPPYYRFIWGDGNKTEDDIREMLMAIKQHGFSATNIVSGMGGGLLQMVDRDTQMFKFMISAMTIDGKWYEVKKEPKTDKHKVSRAGRLDLIKHEGDYTTVNLTPEQTFHPSTELHTIFEDGNIGKTWDLDEIRAESRRALFET
jgi:nicotinamide phosphoribosyltransferase